MTERFFFDQDQDAHWYMIPEGLRETWQSMTANDTEDEVEIDRFNVLFGHYRTGGGISDISFCDPRKVE